MPLTRSSPASSASTSGATQSGCSLPPTGATPITSDLAPAAAAARGSMCGRPVVTLAPGRVHSATQSAPAQSFRPKAVLASTGLVVAPRNNR